MSVDIHTNVEEIVQGCVRGDTRCQQLLYEQMYGKMYGTCLRYARDSEEAKDILHDGFIKVFEKINKFNYNGSLEGWIRRLIVNNAIDYIRKRNKISFEYEGENKFERLKDDNGEVLEKLKRDDITVNNLIELIQDLPPRYKTVFNLFIIEEYSHKEIAALLSISEGASKSNLFKAKIKLKTLYEEKYGEYKYDE